jgi:ABC-type lipoprotein release transport system permease subunit
LLTSTMRGFMVGIDTVDAGSVWATAGLLVLAALMASYLPARRAMRIDPRTSIRT